MQPCQSTCFVIQIVVRVASIALNVLKGSAAFNQILISDRRFVESDCANPVLFSNWPRMNGKQRKGHLYWFDSPIAGLCTGISNAGQTGHIKADSIATKRQATAPLAMLRRCTAVGRCHCADEVQLAAGAAGQRVAGSRHIPSRVDARRGAGRLASRPGAGGMPATSRCHLRTCLCRRCLSKLACQVPHPPDNRHVVTLHPMPKVFPSDVVPGHCLSPHFHFVAFPVTNALRLIQLFAHGFECATFPGLDMQSNYSPSETPSRLHM